MGARHEFGAEHGRAWYQREWVRAKRRAVAAGTLPEIWHEVQVKGEGTFFYGYSGQTTDELLALDGTYRTDSIVVLFEEAIRLKAGRLGPGRLTAAERVVLAVEALEREVNHDGFVGLFVTASEHVPDLVDAVNAIGQPAVAALVQSAIAALAIEGPVTPAAVRAAVEDEDDDRDDRLHALDEAYYTTAGDLAGPLISFIRANRSEITLP